MFTANFKQEISNLMTEIITAHYKNYETSFTGLLQPHEAPSNTNKIFHLYSTGEITYQKGGWAYMQTSEFTFQNVLIDVEKLEFVFVNLAADEISTYVILSEKECFKFREKMVNLIKKIA
jgi:hypothetical protein